MLKRILGVVVALLALLFVMGHVYHKKAPVPSIEEMSACESPVSTPLRDESGDKRTVLYFYCVDREFDLQQLGFVVVIEGQGAARTVRKGDADWEYWKNEFRKLRHISSKIHEARNQAAIPGAGLVFLS